MKLFYISGFLLLTTFLLQCNVDLTNKLIPGEIKNDIYSNSYFTIVIPEDWLPLEDESEHNILILVKIDSLFGSNLIFTAVKKSDFVLDNGKNLEEFFRSKSNRFENKPNYKLTVQKMNIFPDKHPIMFSEFELTKKELIQGHYDFEVGDFYVTITTTESKKDRQEQIREIIRSISFKES